MFVHRVFFYYSFLLTALWEMGGGRLPLVHSMVFWGVCGGYRVPLFSGFAVYFI
jgi:hypothetical protein